MLALWVFASTRMMKSFLFISVFISTYILVQGTEQQTTGSQCQCCDQCDQSATVSKILLDISNMLVSDDQANTTSSPPTTANPSTTAFSTTTVGVTSTTQNPSTIIYSSDIRDSPTTVNPSTTINPSTTVTTSSIADASTKTESYTTINGEIVTNPPSTKNSKTITDSTGKMSVCPDNCTLDISGEYCNCYLPKETKQRDAGEKKELGVASLPV